MIPRDPDCGEDEYPHEWVSVKSDGDVNLYRCKWCGKEYVD